MAGLDWRAVVRVSWPMAAAALLLGCTGTISAEPPARESGVVPRRFLRLSHVEWERTVVDLFGLPGATQLSSSFASDPLGTKAFDNAQDALGVNPGLFSDYQSAAETLAARVTGDPTLLARVLPLDAAAEPRARARAFIASFGLRAYRRPLRESEIVSRLDLFQRAAALYPELDAFTAGVRANLATFLQSPYFTYRTLLGVASPHAAGVLLDGWEVSSLLSYAIWNSMPDQELFRAAAAGELGTDAGVQAQVERMIEAPAADSAIAHFFNQLYQTNQYRRLSKDPVLYPEFTPEIGADMQGELSRFTAEIFASGGGLRQLLTSTTTHVTPRLAALYGLPPEALTAADADGFSRVQLDPSQRAGLLTRSGFLAWKGGQSQPSTIQRGVFVTRRIVCQPLGDPPADAFSVQLGAQATDRERIDTLTGPGTCGAGCHGTYINPAGFAFEHFGALGEYRTTDNGNPIDSSGIFPFESGSVGFRDASELSQALADSPQAHVCFSRYLLEFLLGREPASGDAALLADLGSRSWNGASMRSLIVQTLTQHALRRRAVESE